MVFFGRRQIVGNGISFATGLTLDVLIEAGAAAEIVDCDSNARISA
jgi:hypothetical protein